MRRPIVTVATALALAAAAPPAASAAAGIGAWHTLFYYRMPVPDDRTAAGVQAIKRELIYNGYSAGIRLDVRGFGNAARNQTIRFQNAHGLAADGVIGPRTALLLFRKRAVALETSHSVPGHLTCRQKSLESANDPVAQGVADAGDEGIVQIHLGFHPDVTLTDAWDPAFALGWQIAKITGYHDDLHDWDGAIAAWNIGEYYAHAWVTAGKPPSGHVVNSIDVYSRATTYVQYVKAANC